MTDPTEGPVPEPPPWQLILEHGDRLEVLPPVEPDRPEAQVVLTLRPYRATELGIVLDRYNRRVVPQLVDVHVPAETAAHLRVALADRVRLEPGRAGRVPGE